MENSTLLTKNIQNQLLQPRDSYHQMIGSSLPMQDIYETIDKVATASDSILITGETGTGKELCANAIHQESWRKDKPFVIVNCAAISPNLIESELFGHVKGAFTGAISDRVGAVSKADGGTLFFDEIGELDMPMQSTLLRFLESGTFNKVGSNEIKQVDARILSATNRNLQEEIKKRHFREDLYYRLDVINIKLPALRERGDDIFQIAQTMLDKKAQRAKRAIQGFSTEAKDILLNYDWPGNVRQLKNVISRLVLLSDNEL